MERHHLKHRKHTELPAKRVGRGGEMRTSLRKRRSELWSTVLPTLQIDFAAQVMPKNLIMTLITPEVQVDGGA